MVMAGSLASMKIGPALDAGQCFFRPPPLLQAHQWQGESGFVSSNLLVWNFAICRYIGWVKNLTKQEQFVLCVVMLLLLTGWAVRVYRVSHAPVAANSQQRP
jgi:hypothetical protein